MRRRSPTFGTARGSVTPPTLHEAEQLALLVAHAHHDQSTRPLSTPTSPRLPVVTSRKSQRISKAVSGKTQRCECASERKKNTAHSILSTTSPLPTRLPWPPFATVARTTFSHSCPCTHVAQASSLGVLDLLLSGYVSILQFHLLVLFSHTVASDSRILDRADVLFRPQTSPTPK